MYKITLYSSTRVIRQSKARKRTKVTVIKDNETNKILLSVMLSKLKIKTAAKHIDISRLGSGCISQSENEKQSFSC